VATNPIFIMPNITLRAATPADHAAIRALDDRLVAEAHLPGATPADFHRFQRNFTDAALIDSHPQSRLIVAVDAVDNLLGYIHLKSMPDDVLARDVGYVSIIAVAENRAGRGIGRLLMAAAENWAREQQLPALILDVFASNETARRFYTKAGFGEDSVRLRRSLL
jgi:ribosomal protein S18 acetylase RimI-like enzyme